MINLPRIKPVTEDRLCEKSRVIVLSDKVKNPGKYYTTYKHHVDFLALENYLLYCFDTDFLPFRI